MFTHSAFARETQGIEHLMRWYCARHKRVLLDHHPHAAALMRELTAAAEAAPMAPALPVDGYALVQPPTPSLVVPVLFVNKRRIGGLREMRVLEKQRRLKDLLQFGFLWKDDGPTSVGAMPPQFHDEDMFRGIYRGAPVAAPALQLPTFGPRNPF